MRPSKASWAVGAAAPWCLGAALAVSVPAGAGEEISSGMSFAPLQARMQGSPAQLIASPQPAPGPEFAGFTGGAKKLLREASLLVGASVEFKRLPDEIEPRADLKENARGFPEIDRSRKGDPLAGLRPGFDASLPYLLGPDAWQQAQIVAAKVTNGATCLANARGSTHFHASGIHPRWERRLEKMDVIGHHVFYKLKPGQG